MVSNLSVIQCCNLIDILALNQAYSLWQAVQQDQMNPSISTVMSQGTHQAQMEHHILKFNYYNKLAMAMLDLGMFPQCL